MRYISYSIRNMNSSNQLLRNYQTAQRSNFPFKNNALLNSNPMFQSQNMNSVNNNLDNGST